MNFKYLQSISRVHELKDTGTSGLFDNNYYFQVYYILHQLFPCCPHVEANNLMNNGLGMNSAWMSVSASQKCR